MNWFAVVVYMLLLLAMSVVCSKASSKSDKTREGSEGNNPVVNVNTNSSIYSYIEVGGNISQPYSWVEVQVNIVDHKAHSTLLSMQFGSEKAATAGVNASFFVEQPVYISLTTMASRMKSINTTLLSLIQARVVPDKIYLVISKDPFLLDSGVTHIPDDILCLAAAGYIHIIYTSNQGPHRKLLPVLKRYWNKDVFIATVDDDMTRAQGYIILYQLLKTHVLNNRVDAVVALRARRISICNTSPHRATRYFSWPVVLAYGRHEMLLMPTGTGGILYKPSYFHDVIFSSHLRRATGTADDLMFRLATMMKRIPVALGCSVMYHRDRLIRSCKEDKLDKLFEKTYGEASSVFYKALLAEVAASKAKAVVPTVKSAGVPKRETKPPAPLPSIPAGPPATLSDRIALLQQTARDFVVREANRALTTSPHADSEGSLCSPCADVNHSVHGYSSMAHSQKTYDAYNNETNHRMLVTSGNINTEKDLFSINRRGGNDQAWKMALRVLKSYNFTFEDVSREYMTERGDSCFTANHTMRTERMCGFTDCTIKKT